MSRLNARATTLFAAASLALGTTLVVDTRNAAARPSETATVPLPISKVEALKLDIPANVKNGQRVFTKCRGCHDTGPTAQSGVGPDLNAIVGRKAAASEGYDYSSALKKAGKAGLVWTPYKLDAFLTSPSAFVDGNKMPFAGIADEDARRDLIGYLKTLPEVRQPGAAEETDTSPATTTPENADP